MKKMKRTLPAVLAALILSACTFGTTAGPKATPSPSPSLGIEGYTAQQWSDMWASYDVTPPPSDDPMTAYKRPLPKVQNLTQGKVSDADAQKWADGLLRTESAAIWSKAHLKTGPLSNGLGEPAAARVNTYNISIPAIEDATKKGASRIEVQPADVVAIGLVNVPEVVSAQYRAPLGLSKVAIIIWLRGPSLQTVVYPDGRREVGGGLAAGHLEEDVESGQFIPRGASTPHFTSGVSPFAPYWYKQTEYVCSDEPKLAALCGQVSAPS